jgi:hypothetical protein
MNVAEIKSFVVKRGVLKVSFAEVAFKDNDAVRKYCTG